MKINIIAKGKEIAKYNSNYYNIRYLPSANYIHIICGLAFIKNNYLYVSDPYIENYILIDDIKPSKNDFFKVHLQSGETLNVKCEIPIDHYLFQKIKNEIKYFEDFNFNDDNFTLIFNQYSLESFKLYRYAKDRSQALVITLIHSNNIYYLTVQKFEEIICKEEEVLSFKFSNNELICYLKNGQIFNFKIFVATNINQIINDLFKHFLNLNIEN